jgi:predicted RNA-binding protein YlqC (UPF0109 family)
MTPTTKRHMQLILDLVACYADHPEKIKLTATELGVASNSMRAASVYWRMQSCGEDHGKLAGKGGKNVHALEFLVAELGNGADSDYHFQLVNPSTPAPERKGDTAPDIDANYDVEPMRLIVARVVTEIAAHEFHVTADGVVPGRNVLTHRLTVAFDNQDDHDYFHEPDGEDNPENDGRIIETPLKAVNTLLKAMQRKQGALVEVACVMAKKAVGAK